MSLHVGLPGVEVPTMWLASETLEDMLAGRESAKSARARGGMAIEAPDITRRDEAIRIVGHLVTDRRVQPA